MQPPHVSRSLAAVAVLLLVAACSASPGAPVTQAHATQESPAAPGGGSADPSTDPSEAAGGSIDYCALFTSDQLASIVGRAVHVGDTSLLFGMGCRWDTEDGKGGVVIQHSPVHLGFGDIAQEPGQRPVSDVGDQATIGPAAFFGVSPDGPFDGTIAAAIVGEGFDSVVIAPPPTDDAVIGLLRALVTVDR